MNKSWDDKEKDLIKETLGLTISLVQARFAAAFGWVPSQNQIVGARHRARLGEPKLRDWKAWTVPELERARALYAEGLKPAQIGLKLGRSSASVQAKVNPCQQK